MRRLVASLALGLSLVAASVTAAPVGPVRLTPAQGDSLRADIEKDRASTLEFLQHGANSYLAAIARRDFGERALLVVGRATDCDVRIDDASVSAHHLRVTVIGDSFHVAALDDTATFRTQDRRVRDAVLAPSAIGVGRFLVRLSHQRFPALIVFDPVSPRLAEFKGLRWFPYDPAYRFVLALTPNPRPDTVIINSTRGNLRHALRVGWFEFRVGGRTCRLAASRLLEPGVGESDMSVFFRDLTTGRQSYGLGRYVEVERAPDGRYVLDFNRAYNPACAISPHYNCPVPPRENALKVAIRAGEMDSHYAH